MATKQNQRTPSKQAETLRKQKMQTDMKIQKNDTYSINDKQMPKKNAKKMQKNAKKMPSKCQKNAKKMTRQIQNDKPKCKKNAKKMTK